MGYFCKSQKQPIKTRMSSQRLGHKRRWYLAKAQQKQSLQFPLFLIFLQGMKRTSVRTSLPAFWRQMPTYLKGLRQRLDWKWYIHLSAAFSFWQGRCLILWDGYGYDKWLNHHMKICRKKETVLCVHQGLRSWVHEIEKTMFSLVSFYKSWKIGTYQHFTSFFVDMDLLNKNQMYMYHSI